MDSEDENSLGLLQSVYRDPELPLHVRMRAATVAIAYESPKLSVAARVDYRGMGDAIDAARAKHVAAKRATQTQAVLERERLAAAGTLERPVVKDATFRRIAERITGRESEIGPPIRPKLG
jgi:hypothetical protein